MTPDRFQRLKRALACRQPDLTAVLDLVNKGHNVSAIMRSCDAVGILDMHAVWQPHLAQVYDAHAGGSGKWIRLFLYDSVQEAIQGLKARGHVIVGADLQERSIDFRDHDYTRPTAVVMGAEKYGLGEPARRLLDGCIRIPMMGLSASLNVSVAAGLILYEAQRQRAAAGFYEQRRLDEPTYREVLFEWCYPELAGYCREHGLPYPRLGESGEVLEPVGGHDPERLRTELRKSKNNDSPGGQPPHGPERDEEPGDRRGEPRAGNDPDRER
ncbi:MAG: tRNA (guanosine(18)-2'-O)-methyltransferase TrmH [Armatimonadetes bacterium]|nr:tRNA (guanosine(18)-2'-O)-methyltransferase TrmH [Armatimonadota bacterium]